MHHFGFRVVTEGTLKAAKSHPSFQGLSGWQTCSHHTLWSLGSPRAPLWDCPGRSTTGVQGPEPECSNTECSHLECWVSTKLACICWDKNSHTVQGHNSNPVRDYWAFLLSLWWNRRSNCTAKSHCYSIWAIFMVCSIDNKSMCSQKYSFNILTVGVY